MNISSLIADFFKGLIPTSKRNLDAKPTTHVVRTNAVSPSNNAKLAKQQPKIEKGLVGVGEIPLMSEGEYDKVYSQENKLDKNTVTPNQSGSSFVDSLHDILHKEEGFTTKGYVPQNTATGAVIGQSGVTVGKGFDIGQLSSLKGFDIEPDLAKKIEPYLGLKGTAALKKLRQQPLKLTEDEAHKLSKVIFNRKYDKFNSLVTNLESSLKKPLTENQKIALGSMYYQGVNDISFPKTFEALKRGDFESARRMFENSKWAKHQTPTRAKRTLKSFFEDVSMKEAEDQLSELKLIDPKHRVYA